tara:strand:+ start:71 stop:1282 length:1212 start_codon:yes stop_codon:yes gene_type:complete
MAKKSKINNDEINLIELIYTLWVGKWKIAVAVMISLVAVTSYQSIKKNNFIAITEIKPIGTSKLNNFFMINSLIENININTNANTNTNTNTNTNVNTNTNTNTNTIDAKMSNSKLLNLYLDVLNERTVFIDAIRKFNLLEASQYNNEQEYSEAIIKLASSVKILKPNSKKKNLETSYFTINFIYHDVKKWKSVLIYVDEIANKLAKKLLIDEYNNTLSLLKNEQKYQLEDISIKINNHLIDYDRETSDHLLYLREQSAIATALGIAKSTVEVQTFGQNVMLSNIQTDLPFYLRGYEAIDKEIELINSRQNKTAFIEGLFELEKEKRAIEQDLSIERIKLNLKLTLPATNNKFSAASLDIVTTKFEYRDNIKIIIIVMAFGLMAGIFYVLISNSLQPFRVFKKK